MGAMQVTMIDENKYAETMTDVVLPALEQCCEEGWFDPSAAERSAGIEPLSGIMDTGGRSGQLHYLCYDSAKFDAIREQGATATFRGAIVISHGFTEFAEKYDELVAQIWQPKDPSEPPLASLEYTTELAATSVMLGTYGYTWSYEENGSEQTVTADAPHPIQLEAAELSDARVDGPTEVTVTFDVPCTAAGIVRWPEDELEAAAEAAGSAQAIEIGSVEGDAWTVDDREIVDGNIVFTVEPGWRYAVEAYFDGGEAIYAFTVR